MKRWLSRRCRHCAERWYTWAQALDRDMGWWNPDKGDQT